MGLLIWLVIIPLFIIVFQLFHIKEIVYEGASKVARMAVDVEAMNKALERVAEHVWDAKVKLSDMRGDLRTDGEAIYTQLKEINKDLIKVGVVVKEDQDYILSAIHETNSILGGGNEN